MMGDDRAKRDILLVALQAAPLDRLRLMKTAFLLWHRSGRPREGPFHFQPYLYGPCAFDLYSTLTDLVDRGLITTDPSQPPRWTDYRLTPAGREAAERAAERLGRRTAARLTEIAHWTSRQSFRSLLDVVYEEAPDFAVRSVLR